ncbi:MotA/TolQ/ExbB proton channel family protein [Mycoplasmopsis felis]|uniref:MotA/TolQ/ExbB proton channel family protein n=1 Tax=Mycoplasmopsis felis TaxID=33923 RepID=UPI0021B01F4D|nr:MotA/TolQ/ExbB proton channel family protein [Mycoplasmopsis felis]UWV79162.1 MotA/TolQ/ExbB proton channel family protein [Mycoplasmopsis felis]
MKTLYELFNSKDLTEEINKTKDNITSETPKSQTEPNSDENTETKQLSELDIFKNAYAKMEKEVTDEVNTNNNTLKTFGYVLLALGSIGTIINALAALINLKNKSRKVKGLYLIMGIALAMVIIIAAVFLGVGMKGI